MNRLLLALSLILSSFVSKAADPVSGYYVTAGSDTVRCKIKSGRFLSTPFYGITVINESGDEERLPSKDKKLLAFGFTEGFSTFHYHFFDVGSKTENGFYQLLVKGRYKLYGRPTTVYGGNPTYVLVTPSEAFTQFEPCVLCPWKKQLRDLLKDDAEALTLVENAPRVDIPKFVSEINKL